MVEPPTPIKKANALLGLQFLSDFGDQITTALLALCLLDITQSTSKVGMVYIITTAGYVIFTLVGGVLGDRLSRRKILIGCDIGRGLVVLLLILALREKSIALIYATSFLLAIFSSLHGPVKVSTWAETIPTNKLERYNSLSELSIQASTIIGPLIASFFILKKWIHFGFALDAMTFFLCAVIFGRIVSQNAQPLSPVKRDLFTGFKLIARRFDLIQYISYDAIQMIGFGAFNATFLVLAQRDFAWTKGSYSYHLSIVAIFTTLGALAGATQFVSSINPRTKLISCALLCAIALWSVLMLESFPISSVLVGICDGLCVLTVAVTKTKVQLIAKNIYPESLSSIIASRGIIIKGATLLGTGVCLLINDFISLRATLFLLVWPIAMSAALLIVSEKNLAYRGFSTLPKMTK